MAESQVVTALIAMRAELAGLIASTNGIKASGRGSGSAGRDPQAAFPGNRPEYDPVQGAPGEEPVLPARCMSAHGIGYLQLSSRRGAESRQIGEALAHARASNVPRS